MLKDIFRSCFSLYSISNDSKIFETAIVPHTIFDGEDMEHETVAINCIQVIAEGTYREISILAEFGLSQKFRIGQFSDSYLIVSGRTTHRCSGSVCKKARQFKRICIISKTAEHDNFTAAKSGRSSRIIHNKVALVYDYRLPASFLKGTNVTVAEINILNAILWVCLNFTR